MSNLDQQWNIIKIAYNKLLDKSFDDPSEKRDAHITLLILFSTFINLIFSNDDDLNNAIKIIRGVPTVSIPPSSATTPIETTQPPSTTTSSASTTPTASNTGTGYTFTVPITQQPGIFEFGGIAEGNNANNLLNFFPELNQALNSEEMRQLFSFDMENMPFPTFGNFPRQTRQTRQTTNATTNNNDPTDPSQQPNPRNTRQ